MHHHGMYHGNRCRGDVTYGTSSISDSPIATIMSRASDAVSMKVASVLQHGQDVGRLQSIPSFGPISTKKMLIPLGRLSYIRIGAPKIEGPFI
jgi:hypothetical protein